MMVKHAPANNIARCIADENVGRKMRPPRHPPTRQRQVIRRQFVFPARILSQHMAKRQKAMAACPEGNESVPEECLPSGEDSPDSDESPGASAMGA